MTVAALVADADQAVRLRDFPRAQTLLRQAIDSDPGDLSLHLRLAAVSRAAGKPEAALDAVHRALTLAPLDLSALTMRAGLLERIGDPTAGEAWGHAIAQRPASTIPPPLAAALDAGARCHATWVEARDRRLAAATDRIEADADPEERRRIDRFRSNVVRRTKVYHSNPTHYHFPELLEREFHARDRFPWLAALEALTETVAAEFEAVLNAERAELVPYIQYAAHLPLDQWKPLNHNRDWTAIHLMQNGRPVAANARHCPATMAALAALPQPMIPGASPNAMFSLLAPGTAIPPHVGINNARLVCHLPLVVPDGCWFRVGAETRPWRRGEAFVFDDTIEHEAMNPSDRLRVVFICDVWHPNLTAAERAAVAAIIGADEADVGGI